jgi:4-hydroxy-2-oxoheptanedioate aldolase
MMNTFKQAISTGRTQIGLWQALANPYTAEICAGAGFDWMLLDGEHAPNHIPLLLQQLQAIAAYPVEPVIRIPVADAVVVKQVLDIGARSLLVPMINSVEAADQMVRASRYPPQGFRGIGSAIARASRWNRIDGYLQKASEGICLLLQVETEEGLENLEAIARVDGVDGIFLGPSDLSASLGYIGNPTHPVVLAAIKKAISQIIGSGKAAGILMADELLARDYIEMGATFVAVGTDVTILARGAEQLAAKFRGKTGSSAGIIY